MTNPIPPVIFDAPPVPGSGYGLYAAATLFDTGETARELGGVTLRPYNCDTGAATYGVEMCDDTPAVKTPGERGEALDYTPMIVYAASECAPDQTEAEVLARASHTRTLHEPLLVESAFATKLLADAGAPASAPDFVTALGMIEEFMGEQGYNGVIHAARRWASHATQYRWTNQTGPVYRSPLDHAYAFGGGYADTLGDTLVVTGPVFVWRSAPFEAVQTTGSHVTAAYNNSVYALSERIITVGYECAVYAVTITAP